MPDTSFSFLRALARALVVLGPRLRPGSRSAADLALAFAEEVLAVWREPSESWRCQALQELARATPEQVHREAERIADSEAYDFPFTVRRQLRDSLRQVPNAVRLALQRPDDLSGRNAPFDLRLDSGRDLLPFIPPVFPQLLAMFHGDGPNPTELQTEPSRPFLPDDPLPRHRDDRDRDRDRDRADRRFVRPASNRVLYILLGVVAGFLLFAAALGGTVWFVLDREAKKPKNLIVGKWQGVNDPYGMTLEFRKDGTLNITGGGISLQCTYVWVNDTQIDIIFSGGGLTSRNRSTVKVDKDTLILTDKDGQARTFIRVK
jgi:hypothetical protein